MFTKGFEVIFCSARQQTAVMGWVVRSEASEGASLLFGAGRESLCLPSSLDILVSVKENK